MKDDRVCPICQQLEGYTWTFTDGVPTILEHKGMVVWDEASGSAAHGHKGNCRCRIHSKFDFSDIKARMQQILTDLKNASGTP
jgi:hypothetical protein